MALRIAARFSAILAGGALLLSAGCTPSQLESLPVPEAGPAGISAQAWSSALAAHREASRRGETWKSVIGVIDFTLPSSDRRFWVVDLASGQVLMHEYVAHAMRSGGTWASAFSNRDGSNQSSLGAFVTADPYVGIRGLSLRLKGLEAGFNDRALARGIVLHGTPGVSDARARRGQLGRTEGCPAVSMSAIREMIALLKDGALIYAWYPDPTYLSRSEYVDRATALLAGGAH